jgi:hypothetical protein
MDAIAKIISARKTIVLAFGLKKRSVLSIAGVLDATSANTKSSPSFARSKIWSSNYTIINLKRNDYISL